MMMTTRQTPRPVPNGDLTITEALKVLDYRLSRSTIERAISAHELPARRGTGRAGKPCLLLARDDVLRWHAARTAAADAHGQDSDDVIDLPAADQGAVSVGPAEDITAALARIHREGIAEVGRQVQPLLDRLVHAEARAARAEVERDAA